MVTLWQNDGLTKKTFVGRWTFADSWNLDDKPFDAGPTRDPSCPLYLVPHVTVLIEVEENITKEPF